MPTQQPSRVAPHADTMAPPRRKTSLLSQTLKSEWVKIRTWRTGRGLMLAAPLVAGLASAAFVASVPLTMGRSPVDLTVRQQLEVSMMGVDIANIITMVLAILFVSTERVTNTLQLSLQLTPNRARYLAAKLCVFLLVTVGVSLVSVCFAALCGRWVLGMMGVELPSLASPEVLQLLGGLLVLGPAHAVLGFACAVTFHSGLLAFLVVFFIMCLPSLASLLPDDLERGVSSLLFMPAIHSLAGTIAPDGIGYTPPALALGVIAVWVVVLCGIAVTSFQRQDL